MNDDEKEMLVKETFLLLKEHSKIDKSKISSIQPRFVQQNKSFVVNTEKLKETSDILADDCGRWKNYGQHKFVYDEIYPGKYERIGRGGECPITDSSLILHRNYYINKSAADFRRVISFLTGKFDKIEFQFYGQG